MFDRLTDKMLAGLKKIRGQGKIREADLDAALKEIRLGLLEADVNFKVVKEFMDRIRAKALGQEVIGSVTASQQIVKIVHDELVELLGGSHRGVDLSGIAPHVILMVGLQGAGKTTTSAKLAAFLKKKGRQPLLVSVDVYRPAAREQLKTLAQHENLDVTEPQLHDAVGIARQALKDAKDRGRDVLIVDTAGRLQIDDSLMKELEQLKRDLHPQEILLVADSMTGQDAVQISQGFHDRLDLTGVILTKLDGDARGGAALSIKATTGAPIKFVGISEKIEGLEPFHPDRIAGRILDMGDVVTLVEKAAEVFEADKAVDLQKKLAKNQFTLEDFRDQLRQIKRLGPLEGILKLLPGMGQISKQLKNMAPPDAELRKIEAIISSMTTKERHDHRILNGSRRSRIARGSGTQVADINRFIKQFEQTQKLMQMFARGAGSGRFPGGFPGGGFPGGGAI